MEKGNLLLKMVLYMKENGKIIKSMEKGKLLIQMVRYMKENGKMIKNMEKENVKKIVLL